MSFYRNLQPIDNSCQTVASNDSYVTVEEDSSYMFNNACIITISCFQEAYNSTLRDHVYYPKTLTLATNDLAIGILKNMSIASKWVSKKGIRWAIPLDNPGQDRKLCMDVTRRASGMSIIR